MEEWQRSMEARIADIEETLRHLTVRLVALEEQVAGRTQTVVEELDELRSDVERIKEAEGQ
jgi:hypothetical protein